VDGNVRRFSVYDRRRRKAWNNMIRGNAGEQFGNVIEARCLHPCLSERLNHAMSPCSPFAMRLIRDFTSRVTAPQQRLPQAHIGISSAPCQSHSPSQGSKTCLLSCHSRQLSKERVDGIVVH
jgi:hypothetical protein